MYVNNSVMPSMAYATEPVMLELNMLIDEVGLDNRASIEGNEGNRTHSV